ncbi:S-adenosyl-L-methionine-dependent methyltransferase [Syncephalis fuscata]|nr:S-adenosyl-L-methionine-dependent methyltransferase [Syncephalis fuscata]
MRNFKAKDSNRSYNYYQLARLFFQIHIVSIHSLRFSKTPCYQYGTLQNTASGQQQAEDSSFVYETGRRFHGDKNAPYPLPNDSSESDRLDRQHFIINHLINGNHMGKLANPQKILEVGSGSGTWAKEMAEEFPQSEINCIDISPELSTTKLPSNVKFETMNALEGIKYEDNTFDYVHMRLLCAAMPENSWPVVIKDLTRVCSTGGTIELVETNAQLQNPGPLGQEVNVWIDGIPQMIQEAGLQLETEHYVELPLGEWCDQVGRQGWLNMLEVVNSLSAKIIATSDVTKERIDYVLENLHEEIIANRTSWKVGVFVGHKP